ncbi:MAG TPA: Imm26 family immunity protein [Nitrososphaera sp.]|jgi:hypothetical protein|nr:Imm26 family immunity protein [Nitrososphaera sp.]
MKTKYPFVPKSNQHLSPGDFWAIPLLDGSFGCGVVLELYPKGLPGSRVAFLAGLLNWHGTSLPTSESIAGSQTLEQGIVHILAISQTGGEVLGNRPLELNGIEPWVFINGDVIQQGFTRLRKWKRKDNKRYPTLSWWGYDVIQIYANKHLLGYMATRA